MKKNTHKSTVILKSILRKKILTIFILFCYIFSYGRDEFLLRIYLETPGHCTYDIRLTSDKKIVIKSENIHPIVGNDAVNDTLNMTSIINIDEHNFMKMKKILNEIKKNRKVNKSRVEDSYIYEFYVDDTLIRRSTIQDDNIFRILDCFAQKVKIREFACDQFFVIYKENLDRINKKKKKR